MKQKVLLTVTLFFAMSSNANLIIDKNGVNERDYVFDMHQCEELSHQVQKETRSRGAIGGTLKGAAIGSAGVAIAGGSGTEGAKKGAAVGLGAGVIGGNRDRRQNQANYKQERQAVMRNCITNRGYTVLN